ncbi:MAG TPA: ChaN family lipoprotein, partial [Polyangiaceae bacterium]
MRAFPLPSQGFPNVPGPFEPVGQSVRETTGSALADALGVTLAMVGGGGGVDALAEAAPFVFGSSLHATHNMIDKNSARFMARQYTWLLCVLSLACGAAPKPYIFSTTLHADHPLVGKAWDEKTRAFVPPDAADKAALDVPFVLLGEKHDNADHHRLQARALKAIVDHGRKPSVAFEMIDLDLQRAADAFTQSGSTDVDELGRVLEWDKRGWPAWNFYRPIFEVVVAAHLKIVATGLSHDQARRVVREGPGSLPEEIAERVKLLPLEPAAAASLDEEIKASHCGMLPDAMVPPM